MIELQTVAASNPDPVERLLAAFAWVFQHGPELAAILSAPAAEQPQGDRPGAAEPADKPPKAKRPKAEPKPEGYLKGEPVNPPALAEGITKMEVDALRWDERAALRFIRDRGPLTLRQFKRQYKLSSDRRERILGDLIRFGLVAMYANARGWTIIHATPKAEPLADWEDCTDEWHASCARLAPSGAEVKAKHLS